MYSIKLKNFVLKTETLNSIFTFFYDCCLKLTLHNSSHVQNSTTFVWEQVSVIVKLVIEMSNTFLYA